ncbi:MAG TPA: hypothetical protein VMP11_10830 [Verrucomicrobiae bacterium]|nr:hypothetical protein [Verrucomicrobiae bacterium]
MKPSVRNEVVYHIPDPHDPRCGLSNAHAPALFGRKGDSMNHDQSERNVNLLGAYATTVAERLLDGPVGLHEGKKLRAILRWEPPTLWAWTPPDHEESDVGRIKVDDVDPRRQWATACDGTKCTFDNGAGLKFIVAVYLMERCKHGDTGE